MVCSSDAHYCLTCRPMDNLQAARADVDVPDVDRGSVAKVRRKVGRPVMDHGNPFSAEVTPEQRRVILRRVANRESARRVRNRRNEDLERLVQKADDLERENAILRQELSSAQALELQLKGQLAQLQKEIAAMGHNNADMRAAVACLRQRGATRQPPESSIETLLPILSGFDHCTEFPVQPDTPQSIEASWLDVKDPFARKGGWLGCWDTLVDDMTLESVLGGPSKGDMVL